MLITLKNKRRELNFEYVLSRRDKRILLEFWRKSENSSSYLEEHPKNYVSRRVRLYKQFVKTSQKLSKQTSKVLLCKILLHHTKMFPNPFFERVTFETLYKDFRNIFIVKIALCSFYKNSVMFLSDKVN